MNLTEQQLLKILRIAHDTSRRGRGISLRDAIAESDYAEIRKSFGPDDLLPLIQDHSEFVLHWMMYSEDKRTSGGWYINESSREIGRCESDERDVFPTTEEAVAEYVVRELDFWSAG